MMNLSYFRDYCKRSHPTVILYSDENNEEDIPNYPQRGQVCNPLKMNLAFESISVNFNPNTVTLKSRNGEMRFGYVTGVCIKEADSLLGDTIILFCSNFDCKKSYTLIMR